MANGCSRVDVCAKALAEKHSRFLAGSAAARQAPNQWCSTVFENVRGVFGRFFERDRSTIYGGAGRFITIRKCIEPRLCQPARAVGAREPIAIERQPQIVAHAAAHGAGDVCICLRHRNVFPRRS